MKKNIIYFIGIDMAAETFTAAIFQGPATAAVIKDAITNTAAGHGEFIQWLNAQQVATHNSILCMEATGVYGEDLVHFLIAHGYSIAVEPPLKVKRAFYPVGHKNDRVDSRQIAEYAYRYYDQLRLYQARPEIIEKLKHLLTLREQLVRQSVATKNALKAYRHHTVQEPLVIAIQQQHLQHIKEQIVKVDKHIKELTQQDPSLRELSLILVSLCGVGMTLSAYLLVTTNTFQDIPQYKRMAAFVGICPYEHKSGKSVYRTPHCRPFGGMPIKRLLHLAARSVATHNHQFRKYYLRKIEEGKPKKLVLNNIANKLVKIAFAMARDNQPYIKNYRSVNPRMLVAC